MEVIESTHQKLFVFFWEWEYFTFTLFLQHLQQYIDLK